MISRPVHPLLALLLLGTGLAGASVQAASCIDPLSGSSVECTVGHTAPPSQARLTTVAFADVRAGQGRRPDESKPIARAVEPAPAQPAETLVPHTYALILAGLGAVAFMSGRRHR